MVQHVCKIVNIGTLHHSKSDETIQVVAYLSVVERFPEGPQGDQAVLKEDDSSVLGAEWDPEATSGQVIDRYAWIARGGTAEHDWRSRRRSEPSVTFPKKKTRQDLVREKEKKEPWPY